MRGNFYQYPDSSNKWENTCFFKLFMFLYQNEAPSSGSDTKLRYFVICWKWRQLTLGITINSIKKKINPRRWPSLVRCPCYRGPAEATSVQRGEQRNTWEVAAESNLQKEFF